LFTGNEHVNECRIDGAPTRASLETLSCCDSLLGNDGEDQGDSHYKRLKFNHQLEITPTQIWAVDKVPVRNGTVTCNPRNGSNSSNSTLHSTPPCMVNHTILVKKPNNKRTKRAKQESFPIANRHEEQKNPAAGKKAKTKKPKGKVLRKNRNLSEEEKAQIYYNAELSLFF
jgi:hypothetical protein